VSVVRANGVEVHVEPGEVVVVNGVSVEVQRAGGGKTPRAMPLLLTSSPKVSQPHRRTDIAANQVIIDCMNEHGPLTAGRLLDQLGIDPKDDQRKKTGQRMSRMIAKGILRRVKADRHSGRPRYEVVPTD
jgi:hypothetical protein